MSHVKKSTIIDISRKTGYSVATVSRALNNITTVKATTKDYIVKTAREMNYVPNIVAKHLVQGRSNLIGLILPDENQLDASFITQLKRTLAESRYQVIYFRSDNEPDAQRASLQQLMMLQVDGIIFCPIPGDYSVIRELINQDFPFVIINRYINGFDVNHIIFNFRDGLTEAVTYLLDQKRKYFVELARQDLYDGIERRHTLKAILKSHSIEYGKERMEPVTDTFCDGYRQMTKLLEKKIPIDAAICSSDVTAVGAIRAVYDKKLRIPEDVAVIGCYNGELSNHVSPRISTIETDFKQFSKMITEKITGIIKNQESETETISLPTRFIPRETT